MIKAIIFDLDGTLLQTEILKAKSYALAVMDLRPDTFKMDEVINAFKDVVGLSRREVAQRLLKKFELEESAKLRREEFQLDTAWQVFIQIRLGHYEAMLEDQGVLQKYLCPYNIGLLKWARENDFLTGLATMSHCMQANRILDMIDLKSYFNFIATVDDVDNPKPNPEIYLLVARELNVRAEDCLVIEDSASGVNAALAAKMGCIAVTTSFTRKGVHKIQSLNKKWIVDSPENLRAVARNYISLQNK